MQILGVFPIHRAPDRHARPQDLFHSDAELLGHGPHLHHLRVLDHAVQCDVSVMLNILILLVIPLRLLQGLDDQSRGRRDNGNLRLTVLDSEFDSDAGALPVLDSDAKKSFRPIGFIEIGLKCFY